MWYVIESNVEMDVPEYSLGYEDVYELALKQGKWETLGCYSNLSKASALYDAQEPRTVVKDGKLKASVYMITNGEDPKKAEVWTWIAVGE